MEAVRLQRSERMFVECSYEDAVRLWGEAAVGAVWTRWNREDADDDVEANDGKRRDKDRTAEAEFAREG